MEPWTDVVSLVYIVCRVCCEGGLDPVFKRAMEPWTNVVSLVYVVCRVCCEGGLDPVFKRAKA